MFVFQQFIIIILFVCPSYNSEDLFLKQGEYFQHLRDSPSFQIFCYEGKSKSIVYLWQTVTLEIDLKSDDYIYYEGETPEIVRKQNQEHKSSWGLNLLSWKQKHFKLNPFNQSCIGIETSEAYKVYLKSIRFDYWKFILLALGCSLFFFANQLSKNVLFYYICGILFGVCASFLILIYFISKMVPRKPLMYGVVVCGWTIAAYMLQIILENTRTILLIYRNYVLWYIVITGAISFVACYRWGPVTNERTKNLIRWSLQIMGLLAVFFSSQYQEAAMGLIILILFCYNFPNKWLSKSKTYWKRKFPPKVRLLSNDEYYRQGAEETSKALEDLRVYCSSPKCNQWKTALKLKDVKRFASFIEGSSHLSDAEVLDYESAIIHETDLTDDEDALTDEEY